MSKFVKGLITDVLKDTFKDVDAAIMVNMIGLTANDANVVRGDLEAKGIKVMVVRNLLAARATEGSAMAELFQGTAGSTAVCWGGEDIVSLAKEVVRISEDKRFDKFVAKGGIMDGETFSGEMVKEISKWPSRIEQLSLLVGQIVGPASNLVSAILGPGSTVAGQIAQKAEESESENAAEAAA